MKNIFRKITAFGKGLAEAPFRKMIYIIAIISLFMNIVVEILARGSLIGVVVHIFTSPFVFLVNLLIIFLTLSLCLLIKKRIPLLVFLVALWLGFAIGNAVVLSNRSSPLSAIDFLVLKSAATMLPIYFNIFQIICMALLIGGVVALVVVLFIKFPKSQVVWYKSLVCIGVTFVGVWLGATIISADMAKVVTADTELAETYERYGFAYCFSKSLYSHGIEKPTEYDKDKIDEIVEEISPDDTEGDTVQMKPNIIFVQLESFFDPNHVTEVEYSKNPTPNFERLKKEGVSGYLKMANVGGGTANSEFEVLTGMNLDHFGFGEYPYTTALRGRACESMAANLKKLGYSAHAMHNHTADFYDRDRAYASLGFDSFTPIEMMRNVERNPLGFAKDSVLTDEIIAALDSTDTPDFVFAVSVQAHGKYPDVEIEDITNEGGYEGLDELVFGNGDIEVLGISDESVRNQFIYYVNQVHEMDAFIGELTEKMADREEPTVVVFYGDHMPTLPLTDEDITNGDLYETEYVLFSNYEMESLSVENVNILDRNLEAFELSAYIQKLCGMSEGKIAKLHQNGGLDMDTKDEYLRMLEYSQLYDEEEEFTPSEMSWGTRPIKVFSYELFGNTLYVSGEGFNEYSKVVVDGMKRGTIYINEHTLAVENLFFKIGDVKVVQIASGIGEIYTATISE